MEATLENVSVQHSISISDDNNIVHDSKICKNCLSEMVKAPGHNPLDPTVTYFTCQTCGSEEKVYN